MIRWIIFSLVLHGCLLAQDSLLMENVLELLDTEVDQQYDVLLVLRQLQEHPINLNTARLKDLLQIPFLTEAQARALIRYRQHKGEITSWQQLARLPGFSPSLVQLLRPFVRFQSPPRRWWGKIQLATGTSSRYSGTPVKGWAMGTRWQMGSDHWKAALLMEKDAGEPGYADFISGVVQVDVARGNLRLTAGDFTLAFGQGLLQNGAYGNPASLYYGPIFRRQLVRLQPKLSYNEWAFLRGVAVEYRLSGRMSGGVWASRRRYDARLEGDSVAVTLYTTGYHRDATERQYRDGLTEQLVGVWQRLSFDRGSVAGLVRIARYNVPLVLRGVHLPAQQWQASLAGTYHWQQLRWQGEAVVERTGVVAGQSTVLLRLGQWDFGLVAYHYASNYYSLQSRAFGAFSQPAGNRKGMYGIIQGKWGRRFTLTGYWWWAGRLLEENQPSPPVKHRSQVQLTYQRARGDAFSLRLDYSRASVYQRESSPVWQIRLQAVIRAIRGLRWQTRLQWQVKPAVREKGFAAFQELRFQTMGGLAFTTRWTVYQIPEGFPGIYQYEPDLTGYIRNAYLRDRGYRWMVKWSIRYGYFIVEAKYAVQVALPVSGMFPSQRYRGVWFQLSARW